MDQKPSGKTCIVIAKRPKPRDQAPKPEPAKPLVITYARKPPRKFGYYRKQEPGQHNN